jgi:cell wall-associated NlpC family hydrolase
MLSKSRLIVETVRPLVGKAQYRLGATLSEAPHFFDCSGLVQWAYEEAFGFYIPRLTVNQIRRGIEVCMSDVRAGDILFTTGRSKHHNFYPPHIPNGVGHAGILTDDQTVVCALWPMGVVEISVAKLLQERQFRSIRRIIY